MAEIRLPENSLSVFTSCENLLKAAFASQRTKCVLCNVQWFAVNIVMDKSWMKRWKSESNEINEINENKSNKSPRSISDEDVSEKMRSWHLVSAKCATKKVLRSTKKSGRTEDNWRSVSKYRANKSDDSKSKREELQKFVMRRHTRREIQFRIAATIREFIIRIWYKQSHLTLLMYKCNVRQFFVIYDSHLSFVTVYFFSLLAFLEWQ